MIKDI